MTPPRWLIVALFLAPTLPAATLPADSLRGERLFTSEHCIECHSVNGHGGGAKRGPDLGRSHDRDFSPSSLAGAMWNHAPTMWSAMRASNVPAIQVDDQAAADLFAYFYAARYFEKPGDAGRGKRLFAERSCATCHGIAEPKQSPALPVSQWQTLGDDPVALAAAMWNHSTLMQPEISRRNLKRPVLTGQELTDMQVYLRNLTATAKVGGSFQMSTGSGGKVLFEEKGCAACHRDGGSSITWVLAGKTLTDIAAHMWDHGMSMPSATTHLEAGEMREILSYVWGAQFFESTGDATRGKRVFAAKRCSTCHDQGGSGVPPLNAAAQRFSTITMVSALWRHGPAMLTQMSAREIPWPRFEAREMSDLIAYLNTRK